MSETMIPQVTLQNGVRMPQFGLGVWQAKNGTEVEQAIATAFKAGYRMIDTAAIYGNEEGVGKAIADSRIPREELFITSKLWNGDHAYDAALRAFDESLARLGLEYLDLYLIHWPLLDESYIDAWKALEKLYKDKRIRAIGVSNFKPHHLDTLLQHCEIQPMVNQIELHPKLQQRETRTFCERHGIRVESYSPLMRAGELFEDPVIKQLAAMHNRTPAQIILRWHIQSDLIVIPKSVTPERIWENATIFDFELSDEDITLIDDMDAGQRLSPDPDSFGRT